MSDRIKTVIKIVVTLILVAVSIYFTFKDTNFSKLGKSLENANYFWVVISIPIVLFSHYLRAVRWKIMLKPIIKVKSVLNLFKAVMIGYAANAVTPRGGEFLRPYVYARKENVSFSSTFATIIVERFLDLLTLLVLFGFALLFFQDKIIYALDVIFEKMNVDINPHRFLTISLIILTVLIFSFFPPVIKFILRIIIKPISKSFYEKILGIFEKFRKGFAIIKDPTEYLRIAFYSLAIWFCYGLPNYLMFYAFGFQSRLHLGVGDAFLLLIIIGVSVTIAPTPGAVGVHHVAVRLAMVILYGLNEQDAVAYAILTHAVNYFLSITLGGYYYIRNKKIIPDEDLSSKLEEEDIGKDPAPSS